MGKIKQGILGGFKGKVGTVIGSSWNGIAYMKGQAQSVRNPKTAAQMTQRNFFKEVQELAAQISNEQLAFLFPNSPKNMTRRNMLAQQLAADPIITDNEKHVNLSSLTTIGNAPTAELPTVTIEANENFLNIFGRMKPTFALSTPTNTPLCLWPMSPKRRFFWSTPQ
jgi:hypothetical protein